MTALLEGVSAVRSLVELAEVVRAESARADASMGESVESAIACGMALVEASFVIRDEMAWGRWAVEECGLTPGDAARYRELGDTSPAIHRAKTYWSVIEQMTEKAQNSDSNRAIRMFEDGAALACIAEEFGVTKTTAYNWTHPEAYARNRERAEDRRRERRDESWRLSQSEQRRIEVKSADGSTRLSSAYSHVRSALDDLRRADAPSGEQVRLIGLAMEGLYAAEDAIAKAVKA